MLNELIEYERFADFMADMEIYIEDIDRIADDLRILHSENKKDTQVVSDDTEGLSILIELIQKLKDSTGVVIAVSL